MRELKVGSLFSGIGALDISVHALFPQSKTAWFVEQDKFCQKVLGKRFPGVPIYDDVQTIPHMEMQDIDILVGGFPCQDLSVAGHGAGIKEGTRSGLFFEMWKTALHFCPRLVLFENVPAITINGLDVVSEAISASGWTLEWHLLSAANVGAWHRRQRWWGIAHKEDRPLFDRYEPIGELDDGWRGLQKDLFSKPSRVTRFPRAGMVSGGKLYIRNQEVMNSTLDLWPTPTATERSGINPNTGGGAGLSHRVKRPGMWPTPCRSDYKGAAKNGNGKSMSSTSLAAKVHWPTPTATDYKDSGTEKDVRYQVNRKGTGARLGTIVSARENGLLPTPVASEAEKFSSDSLSRLVKTGTRHSSGHVRNKKEAEWLPGQLNPDWVEPLMGLPSGFTDLGRDIPCQMIASSDWKTGDWEDGIPRLTDRRDTRVSRIKSLGNSVVPQCAFAAFSIIKRLQW